MRALEAVSEHLMIAIRAPGPHCGHPHELGDLWGRLATKWDADELPKIKSDPGWRCMEGCAEQWDWSMRKMAEDIRALPEFEF